MADLGLKLTPEPQTESPVIYQQSQMDLQQKYGPIANNMHIFIIVKLIANMLLINSWVIQYQQ